MDVMVDEDLGYWQPRPWHEEMPLRPKRWPAETWRSAWGFRLVRHFSGLPLEHHPGKWSDGGI